MYFIQHYFYRPPRRFHCVARWAVFKLGDHCKFALTVRRCNRSVRSHPQTPLDLIHHITTLLFRLLLLIFANIKVVHKKTEHHHVCYDCGRTRVLTKLLFFANSKHSLNFVRDIGQNIPQIFLES
jgi:hypothetical protein